MAFEEGKQTNVISIQKLTQEILECFSEQLTLHKHDINIFKQKLRKEKNDLELHYHKSTRLHAEAKEKNKNLLSDRDAIKKQLEKDELGFVASDRENQKLQKQISELQIIKERVNEKLDEKRAKINNLKKKINIIKQEQEKKNDWLGRKVYLYKTYMGLDILPVKENVLRITFTKVCQDEDIECFILVDLENSDPVIDICPQIYSVEKLNYMFKDQNNFYEFLKTIRQEFVNELSQKL